MGGATREGLRALIEDVNAAAIGDLDWARALASLADTIPGVFATFETFEKTSARYTEFRSSAVLDTNEAYLDHYFAVNPRIDGLLKGVGKIVVCDYDFLSEREMDQSEFYVDFLARHGLRYCAGVRADETASVISYFSIQRAPGHGPVDAHEVRSLRLLQPHLRQAALIHHQIRTLQKELALRDAVLGRLEDAVLFVSAGSKVTGLNPAGERICCANDGLTIRHGALRIHCSDARRAVERALAAAAAPTSLDRLQTAQIVVPRRSHGPPYILTIAPVRNSGSDFQSCGDVRTIIFIRDPLSTGRLLIDVLKDAYGLTGAEAALAESLFKGMTIRRFAETRNVTLATARSQLASVMQKLGVHRQTDLVRLLSGLVSTMR